MVDNLEEEHLRREVFTTAIETSSQDINKHGANAMAGSKDASFDLGTSIPSVMGLTPKVNPMVNPLANLPGNLAGSLMGNLTKTSPLGGNST